MKDYLIDLTDELINLCDRYDPYGWRDYVDCVGGDDIAFLEHEEMIMANDPHLYEFLDEVIKEDERIDLIGKAIIIRDELISMHTKPEDREKVKLVSAIAFNIADFTVDDNIANNLNCPEADVWRTVPGLEEDLMKNDLITLKELDEEISKNNDPANFCSWLWNCIYLKRGLVFENV